MFKKNKYKKFGLSRKEINKLKATNSFELTNLRFKNVDITISNPFWFLHSVEELFIDEIYKFNSSVDNPVIIDCGANWGLSVIFFKGLYSDAEIIAYEPDPLIFKLLSKNILNHGFNKVQLENKAVWINNRELSFSSDGGLGGSLTEIAIKKRDEVKIQAIRLKDVLGQYAEIEFLKIDIEGAEYEVIKDCKDNLSHVNYLFIEYHSAPNRDQKLDEILAIVRNAGFKYYIKEAWNNMEHPFEVHKNIYYDLQLNIFCYKSSDKTILDK